jgi:hypothetical protein
VAVAVVAVVDAGVAGAEEVVSDASGVDPVEPDVSVAEEGAAVEVQPTRRSDATTARVVQFRFVCIWLTRTRGEIG